MEYDVAFSFAEEARKYVEAVAEELGKLEFRVFDGNFETAEIGDLAAQLHIYEKKARYTMIFVSENYAKNLDYQLEMRLAQLDREQRLIIARFDESVIESLKDKTFFDLKDLTPAKLSASLVPNLQAYLFNNTNAGTFVSKIRINQSGNISDLTINLSEDRRKHLILIGKNGSGKTSLLKNLRYFLQVTVQNGYGNFITQAENLLKYSAAKNALLSPEIDVVPDSVSKQLSELDAQIKKYHTWLRHFGGNEIYFTNPKEVQQKIRHGGLILKYLGAHRQSDFQVPSGIEKVKFSDPEKIDEQTSPSFIQYLVNLKAEKSFANDDGETAVMDRIDAWFKRFENWLREIFDFPNLRLKFDRKNYNFEIIEADKLPSSLDQLPDGYAAILSIVAELIMKTDAANFLTDELEGLVLIDEIELHLDVGLQKRVLPFLVDFFPKIQFIVTTHSPLVAASISNAVICDLEKRSVSFPFNQ